MRGPLTLLAAMIIITIAACAKDDLRPSKVHAKEDASNKVS